eukprot:4073965-Amphidinium_carterae.1
MAEAPTATSQDFRNQPLKRVKSCPVVAHPARNGTSFDAKTAGRIVRHVAAKGHVRTMVRNTDQIKD